ncbi:hypothetical protein [Methylomonas sp. HYX-M1]|uniref:hypothetical protein n=1 Tax=Methylomonas sp. HYX-M1 TaxID=3139307 RepID=UPI00345BC955
MPTMLPTANFQRLPPGQLNPATNLGADWRRYRLAMLCCVSLIGTSNAHANPKLPQLSFHTFGTGGTVYVPEGNADFIRDVTQLSGPSAGQWSVAVDSLIGGQINLKFGEKFELVSQAVSRHRYDDSYRPELMWALARYSPRPDLDLRGGRLGTDFYMRSDSRLVGYSNLTIRPSVDYYGGVPYYYFDGVDASFSYPVGSGILRSKIFAGFNDEKIPLELTPSWRSDNSLVLGGSLDYIIGSWQFRFGYFQIDNRRNLPGSFETLLNVLRTTPTPGALAAANALATADSTGRHFSAGLIYDEGPLQIQLLISGVKQDSAFLQESVSGYLLGGYRLGDFTPYAGLSWSSSTPARLNSTGSAGLDVLVKSAIARTGLDQHTFTLGLRWDFYPGMDLKAQWDVMQGSPDSRLLYRWESGDWNGRMQVLSLALDFAF